MIIYAPQFKDLVLERLTNEPILTKDLAAMFPDRRIEDVRAALRSLRRFSAADYEKISTKQGPKYLWRRV